MDAFRNNNIGRLGICLVFLMTTVTPAWADFAISEVKAVLEPGKLTVTGNLDLTLNTRVEEAVSKGIPLDVDIELRLHQQRKFLWAQGLSEWTLRRQIRYHALSGQYLVTEQKDGAEVLESFTSLQPALRFMGAINDRELAIEAAVVGNEPIDLKVRVSLDIEALPAPLRPVAYTSLDWHLNSGWTTWKVKTK